MSFLSKLFGINKEVLPADPHYYKNPQEAIEGLREVEALLNENSSLLELKVDAEDTLSRQLVLNDKISALEALKRKRSYILQLQQYDMTLTTLEYQREMLENAQMDREMFRVIKRASEAFEDAYGELDPQKLKDLMENIEEEPPISSETNQNVNDRNDLHVHDYELINELSEVERDSLQNNVPIEDNKPIPSTPKISPEKLSKGIYHICATQDFFYTKLKFMEKIHRQEMKTLRKYSGSKNKKSQEAAQATVERLADLQIQMKSLGVTITTLQTLCNELQKIEREYATDAGLSNIATVVVVDPSEKIEVKEKVPSKSAFKKLGEWLSSAS